ncbi:MAG: hypothetical protein V7731_05150 [Amphritea sp.]
MIIRNKLLAVAVTLSALLMPAAASAQTDNNHSHIDLTSAYLNVASQAEELQQLLEQFDPEVLDQLFQSFSENTEQLGSEAENYLQCLEDQQAIAPSEPLDLGTFISEALITGKACQFLLDDLVGKMQQSPKSRDSQDNMDELLRKSL